MAHPSDAMFECVCLLLAKTISPISAAFHIHFRSPIDFLYQVSTILIYHENNQLNITCIKIQTKFEN